MENEENKGLFYKKDFDDHLVPFVSSVLELSHYSLSLSLTHTFGHFEFLEHFGIFRKGGNKVGKRRKQARRSRNQVTTTELLAGIDLHVYFP